MIPKAILVALISVCTTPALAGRPDGRMGLRWAQQVSATEVRLIFGASFVPHIGADPATYRIVSPTDPDFQRGVRASAVEVTDTDDVVHPAGWEGRRYHRFTAVVTLPAALKPEHKYWVQAMGVNHQPVTGGRAAHWIMPPDAEPPQNAISNRLGLRDIELIAPNIVMLTLGPGVYTPRRAAEPRPREVVYSADFEKGVPASWQAFEEVTGGLPEGNRRAVKAAHLIEWNRSMMVQDYDHVGAFTIATGNAALTFDYYAADASGVTVRLDDGTSPVVHTISEPTQQQWTTVTVPGSEFVVEKSPSQKASGSINVRCLQFIALPDEGKDAPPSLTIDNIRVESGPPVLAGAIPSHDPARYVLRSKTDSDFRKGRRAARMGRRSRIDCYYTDGWPYDTFRKHEVFLQFEKALKMGNTYTIDLNEGELPITCGKSTATLRLSSRETINPIIKVNQLGYLPDAAAKYGYVGAWMGSLGTLDLSFVEDTGFEVRDAETDAVVFRGEPHLRLEHVFSLAPDGRRLPKGAEGKETVYKQDLSYEDIYELDFSALTAPGSYYVVIPGMGRSFTFRIDGDVYKRAYRTCIRGVFHQRCGIEMKRPYTVHYRPACHRRMTELTDLMRGRGNPFELLPQNVVSDRTYDLFGGHHDAGDYNPRSHLDVVQLLLMAYEMTSGKYHDGQNNIPESGNGVPDIIDEALWGLDLWCRLQRDDGGVRNGTESDGDPDMITTPEIDYKRDFAFAADAPGSLRFAGTAAQASLILDDLGRGDRAADLLRRAEMAYQFAVNNGAEQAPDEFVLAAIQMYRATGKDEYLEDFHTHSVFTEKPDAELEQYQEYDQELASFYYAFCERPTDEDLRSSIIRAFERRMSTWIRYAETTGYRYMRHPWAPNTWGTGAYPIWMPTVMRAYTLIEDPEYLKWLQFTCDFSLGCNPMNTVFTVGLGERSITGPLHMYGRYSPDGPIAGTQCEGPLPMTGGVPAESNMTSWIAAGLYPHGPWPQLHTYSDVAMSPGMNEGTVTNMTKTAIAYGFLLRGATPARK